MRNPDIEALLPTPQIYRIAGEELRQQALPIRKLISVIQFVEKNKDLLDRFNLLGKPNEDGGLSISAILEKDVYTRVYALLRLLLPDYAAVLTDDWCMDHISNGHIAAIVKTSLVQNQLYEIFNKAKDLLGPTMFAVFRQKMAEKMPGLPT